MMLFNMIFIFCKGCWMEIRLTDQSNSKRNCQISEARAGKVEKGAEWKWNIFEKCSKVYLSPIRDYIKNAWLLMKIGVFGRIGGEESAYPSTLSIKPKASSYIKKSETETGISTPNGWKFKTSICCWSVFGNSRLEISSQQPGIGSWEGQHVFVSPKRLINWKSSPQKCME